MDFLEFLKNNPGTYSYNKVEFNGRFFRQCNDTFPKFEVVDGTIKEYLGNWTPYTLSSVNTWGAGEEYSILKNGSFTEFNIKISDGCVELYYSVGTRYYGGLSQGEDTETTDVTNAGSSTYEGSSGYIQNPYGKWACYGLLPGGLLMFFAMILLGWWSPIVYAMIVVTWFFSITWNYFFESNFFKRLHQGFEGKSQSFSKSKKAIVCAVKIILIFAPTVILGTVGVLLVISSEMVLKVISKGALIPLYIVFYLYDIFSASYLFHSEYHGIEFINKFILPIIMAAANFIMIILFGVGLGFAG